MQYLLIIKSKLNYYLPRCQHPPPAPNYKNSLYEGRWYEMGRVSYLMTLGNIVTKLIPMMQPLNIPGGSK